MPVKAKNQRKCNSAADEAAVLAELGRLTGSSSDTEVIYARFAEQFGRLISFDRLTIDLIDPDTGTVVTAFDSGGHGINGNRGPGSALAEVVAERKSPVLINGNGSAGSISQNPEVAAALAVGFRSLVAVPVIWEGRVVAALSLWSRSANAFASHDVDVSGLAVAQLAGAISYYQLKESLNETISRKSQEAELLAEISRAATAGLDVDELGARLLNMVKWRVGFDRGLVRVVDADTGKLGEGVAVGLGSEIPLTQQRSRAATEAIALGRIVTDCDQDPEDPTPGSPLTRLGLNSAVTMPLLTDEAVVGIVTLRRRSESGFDEDEIEFATRAARQIASALDNARLLGEVGSLATIVETSTDLICRTDRDGRLQYLNPAGREMVGLSGGCELDGMSIGDLLDEETAKLLSATGVPAALSTGSWTGELRARRTDGSLFPVDALVAVNYHRNGNVLGISISMRDIEMRKKAEEELQRLATTDTLTGLLNRHQFTLMFEQAVRLAERSHAQGALVYLDLDGFKYVNDTHGHTVGDELLCAVAEQLRTSMRASDLVARTGGDEFSVILHDTDSQAAMQKASQLVRQVSEVSISAGSERIHAACSAGVVVFPVKAASVEDLSAYADLAMYRAKEAGRNQANLYDPSEGGREIVSALQRVRTMIVDTVRNDRLVAYRQPIVSLPDRQIAMYEVLARIEIVRGDVRLPMDFIPQAEALDLVQAIDERMIEHALAKWRAFADAGQQFRLSINVSARSVGSDMATYIKEQVEHFAVPHEALTFEITETAAMRNAQETQTFLEEISEAGFKLALDDFGSGATSLKQIRSMKFDFLKLDGSLIQNLKTEQPDREFVRAVSDMAHSMGMEVIAEFVQDEATLDFLAEVGVEYAQGYYLGRPEPFPVAPGVGTVHPSR